MHIYVMAMEVHAVLLYFCLFTPMRHTTLKSCYKMKQKGALLCSIYSFLWSKCFAHIRDNQHKVTESQDELYMTYIALDAVSTHRYNKHELKTTNNKIW